MKLWSSSPANQTGWTSLKTWLLKKDISSLLTKSHFCRTFFRALLKSSLKQNFGKMMAEAVGWEKNEMQEEKVVSLSRPFTQQFQCFLAEITIILSFPLLPLLSAGVKFTANATRSSVLFDCYDFLAPVEMVPGSQQYVMKLCYRELGPLSKDVIK